MNTRYIDPRRTAVVVVAFVVLVIVGTVLFGQDEADRICPELVERVIPITHKGVRYENVLVIGEVPVPCEKPPSSARVETRINPNAVDMDREAVAGASPVGGRW